MNAYLSIEGNKNKAARIWIEYEGGVGFEKILEDIEVDNKYGLSVSLSLLEGGAVEMSVISLDPKLYEHVKLHIK